MIPQVPGSPVLAGPLLVGGPNGSATAATRWPSPGPAVRGINSPAASFQPVMMPCAVTGVPLAGLAPPLGGQMPAAGSRVQLVPPGGLVAGALEGALVAGEPVTRAAAAFGPCSAAGSRPASFTAAPGPPRHLAFSSRSDVRTSSPHLREARELPQPIDFNEDECRFRRPTDPFFYPTTVNPLTGLGLDLIEETTPPVRREQVPSHGLSPQRDESSSGMPFVPAPIRSYVDHPEDMSILQRQNDDLARHMQDLERAKSLAAVQSAQALQKIRTRQEQLRKETQISLQRAKEMQADFVGSPILPGTPSCGFSPARASTLEGVGGCQAMTAVAMAAESPSPAAPSPQERALPLPHNEDISETQFQQAAVPGPGGVSPTAATIYQSSWRNEASQHMQPSSRPRQESQASQVVPGQEMPSPQPPARLGSQDLGMMAASEMVTLDAGSRQMSSPDGSRAKAPFQTAPEPSFSAEGDIAAMAAHFLTNHSAPSVARTESHASSSQQLYVDAMGNPLPPIRNLDDLPNIKDDPVGPPMTPTPQPTPPAVQQRGPSESDEGGLMCRVGAAVGAAIHAESSRAASAASGHHLESDARGDVIPTSARGSTANSGSVPERPTVLVSHERAPVSARGAPSSATDRQGSTGTGSQAGSAAGSRAGHSAAGPAGQAGDSVGVSRSRARQESPAVDRSRGGRHRPSDEVSQSQLPAEISEELQAELNECLDTIKWCASSVAVLLGQPDTRWDKLKQFISKPAFFEKLQRLDLQRGITKEQFRKLRDKLAGPDFDEELIKTVCVPIVPLAMWCRAIGVYLSKTKYRGGPEIRPVAGAGAAAPQPRSLDRRSSASHIEMTVFPDLSRLSPDELRYVNNLTISREGVGTITFQGETDCTDLDLQTNVRLEIGEVLVYPDPRTKPEVGVGLNKAATVTMYQCWPPRGSVDLQDRASQEEYKRRIKAMTEQKSARFIDYDCSTGVWEFAVDHF
eukprot:TRINITY_DN28704_c0_g1_i2.p1 TRINITY_DN28704_c0_g1~~TRINITY_DN28704_c0_g1_i2.p1  ORF type:complete len:987 (-),score=171.96 TRINITY_DN28704_c0_g1_i2:97-3015(-)